MAPRKGTKRVANSIEKEDKISKKSKKQELLVSPNLRKVNEGGVVLCFGQGDVGQLGLGPDVFEKTRPAAVPNYENIVSIAAGGMHNVCLTKDGKVITFGCNDEGALGRDTSEEGTETVPNFVNLPGKVIQVSAGDSHSAALLSDGRVFAWGSFRDSHGTMGLTLKGNEKLPLEMLPSVTVVKIASGADHLILLDCHGRIYSCGCGEQGQLGRISPRSADRHSRFGVEPLLMPAMVKFKVGQKFEFDDIWAGTYCTFARSYPNGDIYAFGLNNYKQTGLTDGDMHFFPRLSKTFSGRKWVQISGGQHHTIALDDEGKVFVMGRKEYGRLGLGPNCEDANTLTQVPALNSFKCIDVGAGSSQSFAVTSSGELYAWGMGSNGQLGTGEEDDVETPQKIKGKQLEDKTVMRVTGGGQHTAILAVKKR